MKTPDRVKSDEELKNETEFYRRKNLANEVEHSSGPRYFEVRIKANGIDLGTRTEYFKGRTRKTERVHYLLPSLKAYEELMKLPVAKSRTSCGS